MSTSHTTTPTTPKRFVDELIKQQHGELTMSQNITQLFKTSEGLYRSTQKDIILMLLIRQVPVTTVGLRALGVSSVSTRIHELRQMGWSIKTHTFQHIDRYSKPRKISYYKLLPETYTQEQAQYILIHEECSCEQYENFKWVWRLISAANIRQRSAES